MKHIKYIVLLMTLVYSAVTQAAITIRFKPNPVVKGDGVEMVLTSDRPFEGVPNLDILKKNFLIGGQQQRQSSQWINGKGSTSYELAYTLFPYDVGTITVQGLRVGNEPVPEAVLTVNSSGNSAQKEVLNLSVQCSKKAVYPGQKMLCEVWLFDSQGIADGEISPSDTNLGVWEQLSAPTYEGVTDNVHRYKTVYSFTPKESGSLTLPPFLFRGEVLLDTRGKGKYRSFLDMLAFSFASTATKPVAIQGEPIQIDVKGKPQDYQSWWLPSTEVTLSETYQMPESVIVGDPIQRTVVLTAKGVNADEMPVPSASNTKNLKVYSNMEQRKDLGDGGQVQVELTFVPTQPGRVELPEIQVPWFDLNTEKVQYATLPGKELVVVEGEGSESAPAPQVATPVQKESPSRQVEPKKAEVKPVVKGEVRLSWTLILVIVLLAFFVGGLITFAALKIRQHMAKKQEKKKPLPDLYPF